MSNTGSTTNAGPGSNGSSPAAKSTAQPARSMRASSKPSFSIGGDRWAIRTLWSLFWLVVGVLGITTLNGYASSGFTQVPNAFMQIFGPVISPMPHAPKGYLTVTPAKLSHEFASQGSKYLGQNVFIFGRVLPWEDVKEGRIPGAESIPIKGLQARPGTFQLALFADPEEHPEMATRPVTTVIRVPDGWREQHAAFQGQWVQVLGAVVAYSPGGGEAQPEIQSTDVKVIQEPYDIYDHNIPIANPSDDG